MKEKQMRTRAKNVTTDAIAASLRAIALESPERVVDEDRKEPAYVPYVMEKSIEASQSPDAASQSHDENSSDDTFTSAWESGSKERAESPVKIVIKNTFIQISNPPSEPPTRSAPGAMLLKRFRLKQDQGEALTSDALQSGTKEAIESPPLANTVATTARQTAEAIPNMDRPEEKSREEVPVNGLEAHILGQCAPCAYFWYKADGCRQGAPCKFCHLCDKGEIKRRKRERILHLKESGQFVPGFRSTLRKEPR
jgi:hypothetical protein